MYRKAVINAHAYKTACENLQGSVQQSTELFQTYFRSKDCVSQGKRLLHSKKLYFITRTHTTISVSFSSEFISLNFFNSK
jgi:hypothetical protein